MREPAGSGAGWIGVDPAEKGVFLPGHPVECLRRDAEQSGCFMAFYDSILSLWLDAASEVVQH